MISADKEGGEPRGADGKLVPLKTATLSDSAIAHIRKMTAKNGYVIVLSGTDGSGKSTTAKMLCEQFAAAGLTIVHRHCHAWRRNLTETPGAIARARTEKSVMVLDRSIYDNIIEAARKLSLPKWAVRFILRFATAAYPAADLKLFAWAPLEELLRRRPDEAEAKQAANLRRYQLLERAAGFQRLQTNEKMLTALSSLITE